MIKYKNTSGKGTAKVIPTILYIPKKPTKKTCSFYIQANLKYFFFPRHMNEWTTNKNFLRLNIKTKNNKSSESILKSYVCILIFIYICCFCFFFYMWIWNILEVIFILWKICACNSKTYNKTSFLIMIIPITNLSYT